MSIQIKEMLDHAAAIGVNDILLRVGMRPMFRYEGLLLPYGRPDLPSLEKEPMGNGDMEIVFSSLVPSEAHRKQFEANHSVDFSIEHDKARFRVNVCQARGVKAITLRLLPSKILTYEEIGLPKGFISLTDRPRGLLLVTGATGSGKTTTLASVISKQLDGGGRHVYVVEQPTEYVFGNDSGVLTQREVPTDSPSFADALNDALRANPDTIVVGEMRDLPTIRAALTAAETGHLVLATLHTSTASSTINRIIDVFPETEKDQVRTQLAMSLLGVLCQQLIPCCEHGQVVAMEFMCMNPAVANMIRDNRTNMIDNAIQVGRSEGMQLLDDHLFQLVVAGRITGVEALYKAKDPKALNARFGAEIPGMTIPENFRELEFNSYPPKR